jgi:hypothetical protein
MLDDVVSNIWQALASGRLTPGGAVQLDSIKTRVDAAYGFSA